MRSTFGAGVMKQAMPSSLHRAHRFLVTGFLRPEKHGEQPVAAANEASATWIETALDAGEDASQPSRFDALRRALHRRDALVCVSCETRAGFIARLAMQGHRAAS